MFPFDRRWSHGLACSLQGFTDVELNACELRALCVVVALGSCSFSLWFALQTCSRFVVGFRRGVCQVVPAHVLYLQLYKGDRQRVIHHLLGMDSGKPQKVGKAS